MPRIDHLGEGEYLDSLGSGKALDYLGSSKYLGSLGGDEEEPPIDPPSGDPGEAGGKIRVGMSLGL